MSSIVIQGIKYDDKSSYQKGSRKAPALIRKALYSGSYNLFTEKLDSIEDIQLIDRGDFGVSEYFEIERITAGNLAKDRGIFTLGGDHSITFPIIKALQQVYPKIDILQIDAHSDLYDEYEGDRFSHACPFARIMESKLASRLVQVGIRATNPHQIDQANKYGVEIHQMKDIAALPSFKFNNPVYISLDLDGIDPAYAPGVSHHEPGGLSSRQVIEIIHNLEGNVIGADIVEYNPDRDHQDMTAYLAAKLMKELLGKICF